VKYDGETNVLLHFFIPFVPLPPLLSHVLISRPFQFQTYFHAFPRILLHAEDKVLTRILETVLQLRVGFFECVWNCHLNVGLHSDYTYSYNKYVLSVSFMVMQAVFHRIYDLKCAFGTDTPMKRVSYVTVLCGTKRQALRMTRANSYDQRYVFEVK
jgi:hypothetical protein